MFSRLTDPNQCVLPAQLQILSNKLNMAMLCMAKSTKKGGNPFLFALTATKPHELAVKIPNFHLKEFTTAASTGKKFYWHPDFLDRLDINDIVTVINHESTHILLDHTKRSVGKNAIVWNIATDFIVNSIIEHDYKITGRSSPWKSRSFGHNISLNRLLSHLCGQAPLPAGKVIFTDASLYKSTLEDIYQQILEKWPEDNDLSEGAGLVPLDSHVPAEGSSDDMLDEIMMAAKQAEVREPGSVPKYIQGVLLPLSHPRIDFLELIRYSLFSKNRNEGLRNDWKRPRRRGLAIGHYIPKRYTYKPKWLCLLDTSASMKEEDIAFGISQLQTLGENTDGIVVPCDSKVHWDKVTQIQQASDIASVQIIGRGGTTFKEFFQKFPEIYGNEFDIIIVITDGMCGQLSKSLAPLCDSLWVITNNNCFAAPFGRSINLR